MTIKDKAVLVTGANRGIGQALAAEALARGAKRVYAGTRQLLAHPDDRVTPLSLDVTSTAQIRAAASQVESLDMLINNAGIMLRDDLTDPAVLERHMAVNLYGPYAVTQAFLPAVTRSRGAIVNILSVNALAPLPLIIPAYSVSKAAAFSLTQSLLLAGCRAVARPRSPGPRLGGASAWLMLPGALSGVPPPADGERPVDVAGVFLERHPHLADRS
jgi:NAD(P)-dependent dehydrogenase (short-subunit alcohol dehydrogenase family)